MRDGAKEYILEPAGEGPAAGADRRAKLRAFWKRAWEALRARHISRGAFTYLRYLFDWAKDHGDGESFTKGERWQRAETGFARETIAVYRHQLKLAGLIAFDRKWAFKRGWFYEAQTSLLLLPPSGLISRPESGLISRPESGLEIRPSLIRVSLVAPTKLIPPGGSLSTPAAPPTESKGGKSSSSADRNVPNGQHKATKGGKFSLSHKEQSDASKKSLSTAPANAHRFRELMGRLRKMLQEDFSHDAGKWGGRAKSQPKLVERILDDLGEALKTGKPIRKGRGAYVEDLWKRWS